MTTLAGNSVLYMFRVRKSLLIAAALMAREATFGVLFRIRMKGKNQFVGRSGLRVIALRGFLGVGMRLPRAVTHFAAGYRVRVRWFERGVRGFAKLQEFRLVTRLAAFCSRILSGDGRGHRSHANRRRRWHLRTGLSENSRVK